MKIDAIICNAVIDMNDHIAIVVPCFCEAIIIAILRQQSHLGRN